MIDPKDLWQHYFQLIAMNDSLKSTALQIYQRLIYKFCLESNTRGKHFHQLLAVF